MLAVSVQRFEQPHKAVQHATTALALHLNSSGTPAETMATVSTSALGTTEQLGATGDGDSGLAYVDTCRWPEP